MTLNEVEKYRLPVRILHWVHSGAFILLLLTGMMLYLPRATFHSLERWTHPVHLVAAVVFIGAPLLYLIILPASALRGLRQAFTWGKNDLKWLVAAPRYYFLGDEKNMPPQGLLNSGQKLWWLLTIISGIAFTASGAVMWFFVKSAPAPVLSRMSLVHDISFIVAGAMFLLHLYLGAFRPKVQEAWKAMTKGKISTEYAESHHGKWYADNYGEKKEQ
jgi:formate dehydrogenase subunit gamma